MSARHTIVAVGSATLGGPSVVGLALGDRWAGALALGTLLAVYGVGEFVLWLIHDRQAAGRRWHAAHDAAGPLTGYTPQTDDRMWRDFDRSHGGAA